MKKTASALGYNSQGIVSAIGVSGAVAKNNEVIYEGTWIAANNAGLNALGVNSAAEYKQKVQEERRQNLVISMNKLKTERIMRQRELARQEELARSGANLQQIEQSKPWYEQAGNSFLSGASYLL